MKTLSRLLSELALLAAAGLFAWFFPKTFLVISAISAVITIALRMVERSFK